VVDDFLPVANAMMSHLQTNFYDARMALDGAEALAIAEEFRPHALIADMILPDMDGFVLAAKFERLYPGCRVLLMSAGLSQATKIKTGLRVVPKTGALDEAYRLLDDLRWSEEV
jgi:two-component system OmpR family response regulator